MTRDICGTDPISRGFAAKRLRSVAVGRGEAAPTEEGPLTRCHREEVKVTAILHRWRGAKFYEIPSRGCRFAATHGYSSPPLRGDDKVRASHILLFSVSLCLCGELQPRSRDARQFAPLALGQRHVPVQPHTLHLLDGIRQPVAG